MVALTVSHFSWMESVAARRVGNLPALLRPGPRRRGICLIRVSEARNASYFLANFLTTFLVSLNLRFLPLTVLPLISMLSPAEYARQSAMALL